MKIGYQGAVGSNAEAAAKLMAQDLGYSQAVFIPLISSKEVFNQLQQGKIELGVAAVSNTLGGVVTETEEAIKGLKLEVIAQQRIAIHHYLFKKNKSIEDSQLNKVVSHIQALKQTENTRKRLFPDLEAEAIEDTAIGAKWLAEGKLPETTAVICRRNAGELYHLALVKENIEDSKDNKTLFKLFNIKNKNIIPNKQNN